MPARLGQFYAFVLLLICLAVNITFFSDVRKSYFGDADPLASAQSTLADWDIRAKISDLYQIMQSKVDDAQNVTPIALSTEEKSGQQERRRLAEPPVGAWAPGMGTIGTKPTAPSTVPEKSELPTQTTTTPTAETLPAPQPAAAKSPVANQFKPITVTPNTGSPKSTEPVKPSAQVVWNTTDTALERPIRYDR